MTQYTKPSVLPAWAETGDKTQPTNPEIQTGWPLSTTPPSRQRFNWILNWVANAVRYFLQMGIPAWDATEDYPLNGRVQLNGAVYRAIIGTGNTNKSPDTNPTYWETEKRAWYADDTGAVNAYVVNPSLPPNAYFDGMEVSFSTANANTTSNPTVNVNGLGAIAITNPGGGVLLGGQIPANSPVKMIYNSTGPRFELVNRALTGNLNGMDSYSATGSIPASGFGKLSRYTGSTAAQTLTLPAANAAPVGSIIWLQNQASVPVGIARTSTDTINVANPYGATLNVTSFTLGVGDSIALVSDGSGAWNNLFAPNAYKFASSYAVGSNSYQRIPSGLILQFGSGATTVGGTVGVTFATAFPTGIIMAVASVTQNTLQICEISAKSTTGFTANTYVTSTGASGNCAFDWIAIGF